MSIAGVSGLVTGWLAQMPPPGSPPGSERGEEFGKSSPIALVVILLLGLATALLIRSMNRRLRNVPESFDPPDTQQSEEHASTDGDDASEADPAPPSVGGIDPDRTEGQSRTGSP